MKPIITEWHFSNGYTVVLSTLGAFMVFAHYEGEESFTGLFFDTLEEACNYCQKEV